MICSSPTFFNSLGLVDICRLFFILSSSLAPYTVYPPITVDLERCAATAS